jgi:plastocyanin
MRTATWRNRAAIWRYAKLCAAGATLATMLPAVAACGGSSTGDGGTAPATTGAAAAGGTAVNMTEVLGPPDKYAFTPAAATVSSGGTISITNKTDENHSLACTPDGGATGVTITKAGSGSLSFSKAGTFVCSSTEHPEAKLTVTVQ